MVRLNLYIGRRYDGYGEQVPDKEQVCLTNEEAALHLEKLLYFRGTEFTREWLRKVKGINTPINEEDTSS
jgi:hypothetical protein